MLDAAAERLEEVVLRRHRGRLSAAGWPAPVDTPASPWAPDGRPPTDGNLVDVLVDGADALPAIAAAVRSATDHVHLHFWALDPGFRLERGSREVTLRELLAEAADRVDVRVLVWRGAPLPVMHPWFSDAHRALRELCDGTRIQGALDGTGLWTAACHEKVVVVDGREAFVGGIDPTTLKGDRFDRSGHPHAHRSGWHDAFARVRGPAVADVAAHFAERWREATAEELPPPMPAAPAGSSRVQIVRTLPAPSRRGAALRDFSGVQGHVAALRGARKLIYIESQFLWSVEIVGLLADKLRHPPDPDFRIVVVLPRSPRAGYDATRGQLRTLMQADAGEGRFLACSLRTSAKGSRHAVYLHAKLVVVDDAWLSIGSMNMSDHGLFNAVEVQLVTDDAVLARQTRTRLWAEHLDLPEETVAAAPAHEIVDVHWRPAAERQLSREKAGLPLDARIVRLEPGRALQRLLGVLQTLAISR